MAYQADQTIREGARRVDEIHGHRQARSVWPWILSLLALALAAWALLRNRTPSVDTSTPTRSVPSATSDSRESPTSPRGTGASR